MNVLFLGNNHNTESIACLEKLATDQDLTLLVGFADPAAGGYRGLKLALKRYGIATVVKKIFKAAGAILAEKTGARSNAGGTVRSLQSLARSIGADSFFVQDINAPDDRIQAFRPDLVVVANFSQILKADILKVPPHGCINMHPSLLPQYRGPVPSYWILKNREKLSGVTVHYIDEGVDSGDIILQEEILIEPGETEKSLDEKAMPLGASMLLEAAHLIRDGRAEPRKQNPDDASYYSFPRLQRKKGHSGIQRMKRR